MRELREVVEEEEREEVVRYVDQLKARNRGEVRLRLKGMAELEFKKSNGL